MAGIVLELSGSRTIGVGEHLFFGVVQVMSDWTSGYVADIGYTYGYYSELNPLRIKLAFFNARLGVSAGGNGLRAWVWARTVGQFAWRSCAN